MTARQIINHPTTQFFVYAVIIGIAWGTLKSEVRQKADRTEVAETAAKLTEVTKAADERQAAQLAAIASDMRVVRAILCERASRDSFCRRQP